MNQTYIRFLCWYNFNTKQINIKINQGKVIYLYIKNENILFVLIHMDPILLGKNKANICMHSFSVGKCIKISLRNYGVLIKFFVAIREQVQNLPLNLI